MRRTKKPRAKAAPRLDYSDTKPASQTDSRARDELPETPAAFTSAMPAQFPLFFQPYLSLQFHDGSSSHLPWMQELPDPASSAIWTLPVELDAKTANNLGIS